MNDVEKMIAVRDVDGLNNDISFLRKDGRLAEAYHVCKIAQQNNIDVTVSAVWVLYDFLKTDSEFTKYMRIVQENYEIQKTIFSNDYEIGYFSLYIKLTQAQIMRKAWELSKQEKRDELHELVTTSFTFFVNQEFNLADWDSELTSTDNYYSGKNQMVGISGFLGDLINCYIKNKSFLHSDIQIIVNEVLNFYSKYKDSYVYMSKVLGIMITAIIWEKYRLNDYAAIDRCCKLVVREIDREHFSGTPFELILVLSQIKYYQLGNNKAEITKRENGYIYLVEKVLDFSKIPDDYLSPTKNVMKDKEYASKFIQIMQGYAKSLCNRADSVERYLKVVLEIFALEKMKRLREYRGHYGKNLINDFIRVYGYVEYVQDKKHLIQEYGRFLKKKEQLSYNDDLVRESIGENIIYLVYKTTPKELENLTDTLIAELPVTIFENKVTEFNKALVITKFNISNPKEYLRLMTWVLSNDESFVVENFKEVENPDDPSHPYPSDFSKLLSSYYAAVSRTNSDILASLDLWLEKLSEVKKVIISNKAVGEFLRIFLKLAKEKNSFLTCQQVQEIVDKLEDIIFKNYKENKWIGYYYCKILLDHDFDEEADKAFDKFLVTDRGNSWLWKAYADFVKDDNELRIAALFEFLKTKGDSDGVRKEIIEYLIAAKNSEYYGPIKFELSKIKDKEYKTKFENLPWYVETQLPESNQKFYRKFTKMIEQKFNEKIEKRNFYVAGSDGKKFIDIIVLDKNGEKVEGIIIDEELLKKINLYECYFARLVPKKVKKAGMKPRFELVGDVEETTDYTFKVKFIQNYEGVYKQGLDPWDNRDLIVTDYENKRIPVWMVEEYHLQNNDKVKVTQKIKQKKNKLLWQIVDIKKLETE